MLIVDCHAHLYADDPARYPPRAKPLPPPPGTGSAAHRRLILGENARCLWFPALVE